MSILTNLSEIPQQIKKTQLKLDEVIALLIFVCLNSAVVHFPDSPHQTTMQLGAPVFLFYALKCLRLEKILLIGLPFLILGPLAKLEHWWWASYMLIIGIVIMSVLLVFIALSTRKRNDQRIIILSMIIFMLAILSKLEYWSIMYPLSLASVALMITGVSYRYYLKENKNSYDLIKYIFLVTVLISWQLKMTHLPYYQYTTTITALLFIIFIILSFVDIYKNRIFTK